MLPTRAQINEKYKDKPQMLRYLDAWIADYQSGALYGQPYKECRYCGWPHSDGMCTENTFARVKLGNQFTFITVNNIEWTLSFLERYRSNKGFHWKDDIYFAVKDGNVLVSRIEYFNGHPNEHIWTIPLEEWKSIVDCTDPRHSQPTGNNL